MGSCIIFRNTGKIQNAVSIRIFNVFGDGQNFGYPGVITNFAERLSAILPPVIYGNGIRLGISFLLMILLLLAQ